MYNPPHGVVGKSCQRQFQLHSPPLAVVCLRLNFFLLPSYDSCACLLCLPACLPSLESISSDAAQMYEAPVHGPMQSASVLGLYVVNYAPARLPFVLNQSRSCLYHIL